MKRQIYRARVLLDILQFSTAGCTDSRDNVRAQNSVRVKEKEEVAEETNNGFEALWSA